MVDRNHIGVVFILVVELYYDLEGFEVTGGEEVKDCTGAVNDAGEGIQAKEVLQEEEIAAETVDHQGRVHFLKFVQFCADEKHGRERKRRQWRW